MKNKLKIVLASIILVASLFSSIPAKAEVSTHQPWPGYIGILWCSGNGVRIYEEGRGVIGYLYKGDTWDCDLCEGSYVYDYNTITLRSRYVSRSYLSTVPC